MVRVVIIGGTAAGMSAAVKAKKLAKESDVVVYEKSTVVSFGACGLPYFIAGYFNEPKQMIARTKEEFFTQGVKVKDLHEVLAIDSEHKQVVVKNLKTNEVFTDSYDKLVIATGATAVLPPVGKTDFNNLFTLKSMADGQNLKAYLTKNVINRVTIVGAGFIGVELVEAMLHLGKEVQLIQLADHVMTDAFDPEISEVLEDKLRTAGVQLHLGEAVKEFSGFETVSEVITDKGSYPTDLVVVAIGVRPATKCVGEEFKKLGNGAIIVDETGRTNVVDVFAAGDCASVKQLTTQDDVYLPLATGANKLGRIVGENIAGVNSCYPGSLGTSGVKFEELEVARTGITAQMAEKLGLNYKTVVIDDKNQTSYYPGQKEIRVKLVYDADTLQLIGGQVVGENGAALRINVLAQAIATKQTTKDLGMLDLLYAPPFARTWDVLNVAGNVAK
jgi:NADPH-dependent 2,4-dienoyl-CoA reductase/sulfur reductase-like enzyme